MIYTININNGEYVITIDTGSLILVNESIVYNNVTFTCSDEKVFNINVIDNSFFFDITLYANEYESLYPRVFVNLENLTITTDITEMESWYFDIDDSNFSISKIGQELEEPTPEPTPEIIIPTSEYYSLVHQELETISITSLAILFVLSMLLINKLLSNIFKWR